MHHVTPLIWVPYGHHVDNAEDQPDRPILPHGYRREGYRLPRQQGRWAGTPGRAAKPAVRRKRQILAGHIPTTRKQKKTCLQDWTVSRRGSFRGKSCNAQPICHGPGGEDRKHNRQVTTRRRERTLNALWSDYMRLHVAIHNRPRTSKDKQQAFATYIEPELGSWPISEIDRPLLEEFLAGLARRGTST